MARDRTARRDAGGAELNMRGSVGWAKSPAMAEIIVQRLPAILPTRSSGAVLRRGQRGIAGPARLPRPGGERGASFPPPHPLPPPPRPRASFFLFVSPPPPARPARRPAPL